MRIGADEDEAGPLRPGPLPPVLVSCFRLVSAGWVPLGVVRLEVTRPDRAAGRLGARICRFLSFGWTGSGARPTGVRRIGGAGVRHRISKEPNQHGRDAMGVAGSCRANYRASVSPALAPDLRGIPPSPQICVKPRPVPATAWNPALDGRVLTQFRVLAGIIGG